MKAEEFREHYAKERGYISWSCLIAKRWPDIFPVEADMMNAFATHIIEEVREKARREV